MCWIVDSLPICSKTYLCTVGIISRLVTFNTLTCTLTNHYILCGTKKSCMRFMSSYKVCPLIVCTSQCKLKNLFCFIYLVYIVLLWVMISVKKFDPFNFLTRECLANNLKLIGKTKMHLVNDLTSSNVTERS